MNSWYTIRAQATGAEVVIYDEIGAYGVSAKGFLAELGALPDATPLALRLNSPGGSVFDAVAIYNAIKRHSGTVTVWIDGIAASAASYIAMAGDEIVMPENAFLMIHDPAGVVMGTAIDMRAMAEALDKIKGSLLQGYAAKSGRSQEEIAPLMAAETWLDAKDALDLGFADRIAETVRIAARFDVRRFRNAPPLLVEGAGDEAEYEASGTAQADVDPASAESASDDDAEGVAGNDDLVNDDRSASEPDPPPIPARRRWQQMPPVPCPLLMSPPCAPTSSPMPAPSWISAVSRGSRKCQAGSLSATPVSTRSAPPFWPTVPRRNPTSPPPIRNPAARLARALGATSSPAPSV